MRIFASREGTEACFSLSTGLPGIALPPGRAHYEIKRILVFVFVCLTKGIRSVIC